MAITREELKKLVIQESLKLEEENFLSRLLAKGKIAGEIGAEADKIKNTPVDQRVSLVADFIQANRKNPIVQKSAFMSKLYSVKENKLQEVYESDISQIINQRLRDKKISIEDIDRFISDMAKNPELNKQLVSLKLINKSETVPTSQTSSTSSSSQANKDKTSPTITKPDVKQASSQPADKKDPQQTGASVPVFKATQASSDILSLNLKRSLNDVLATSKIQLDQKTKDLILTQYIKMIVNQLRTNKIKVNEQEASTDPKKNLKGLETQLKGFVSQTATGTNLKGAGPLQPGMEIFRGGTGANIKKGSIDAFGPAVLLLKYIGNKNNIPALQNQKNAAYIATKLRDATLKHLNKHGVKLPQQTARTKDISAPQTTPAAASGGTTSKAQQTQAQTAPVSKKTATQAIKGLSPEQQQRYNQLKSKSESAEGLTDEEGDELLSILNLNQQSDTSDKKPTASTPEKTSGSSTATTSNVPELDADDMEQDQPIVNAPTSPQTKSEPEQPEQKNDSNIPQPAEETGEEVGSEQPAGEKSKEEPEQKPSQEIPANLQNLFKSGLSKEEANNAAVELGRRLKNPQRGKEIVDKFNKWVLQQGLVKENTNSIIRNYIFSLLLERKAILLEAFLADKIKEFADKNGISDAERKALVGAIEQKVVNVKKKKEKTTKQSSQQTQTQPEPQPEQSPESGEKTDAGSNEDDKDKKDEEGSKEVTHESLKEFINIMSELSSLANINIKKSVNEVAVSIQEALNSGQERPNLEEQKQMISLILDKLTPELTDPRNEQVTAEKQIKGYLAFKKLKDALDSIRIYLDLPPYAAPSAPDVRIVGGEDTSRVKRVVGIVNIGILPDKKASVIIGEPNSEVKKAIDASQLNEVLIEEIYNLLTGKTK